MQRLTVFPLAALVLVACQDGLPLLPNQVPTATFSVSCTDLSCTFSDQSTDSDGSIASWSWDFGDGSSSSAQNPSHTYSSADIYTVTLTVTDNHGDTDNTSQAVTVSAPNQVPTAAFSVSCTDLSCSFSDQSTDSDGSIASWSWDFGDGSSSSAQNPSHTYSSAGTYSVTLTVTDNHGDIDNTSQAVTVSSSSLSGRIVFSRHVGFNNGGLMTWGLLTMASDGSGVTPIGTDQSTGASMTPAGSPDGRRVAYLDREVPYPGSDNTMVKVVNADGTGVYDLWPTNNYLAMPSFSPDGRRIATRGEVSPIEHEVIVLDSDGSNPRVLFQCIQALLCSDLRLSPQAWWPSETYVLVSYRRPGSPQQIYNISVADGSSEALVSDTDGEGVWDPAVSVDGWIAFTSDDSGNLDIWVTSLPGTATQLTTSSFDDFRPVWSGDGSRLAFVSTRDGNAEIYAINRDGTGLTRLTTNSVADTDPHWVP